MNAELPPPMTVRRDEPMARHTSWRAGGSAAYYAEPANLTEAVALSAWARERSLPLVWIGRGTNLLVCDSGFAGVAAAYRDSNWELQDSGDDVLLTVGAGQTMSSLARRMAALGLAGMEWAEGLPGTVGGAVVGNAGCYGGDTAGIVREVTLLLADGSVETWPAERLDYSYRESRLKHWPTAAAPLVVSAVFALQRADPALLQERVAAIAAQRKGRSPGGNSCGSVFKNPPGDSAGRLIEAAGLKLSRCGDAEISAVHANYIVNRGRASAADILTLIDRARSAVRAQYGRELQLEVRLLGDCTPATPPATEEMNER
jgi:UDP-N-acetylmuramate dehydrogenase